MSRSARFAVLALLAGGAAACTDTPTAAAPDDPVPSHSIDVNDPRGELVVEVRYDGAFHDAGAPVADNACQLLLDVNVPTWSGNAVRYCEASRTTVINPGEYSARSWIYDGYTYPTLESGLSVTVTAGQTTVEVFDFADWTGIVEGSVVVDGEPADSRYRVCLSTGGCTNIAHADGSFRLVTGGGSGTGVIRNELGTELGSFTYSATAGGAVTAVGSHEVADPRAQLTVEVRYGGGAHDYAAPIADNACQLLLDVSVPSWSGNAIRYCESSRTTTVVPGTYGMRPWIYDGHTYPTLASGLSVTLSDGDVHTEVVDFAQWTGIVTGIALVDGVPADSRYRVCLSTGGCTNIRRQDGSFRLVTGGGAGSGVVKNEQNIEVGSFTYTASVGGTVDVGEVTATDPRAELTVELHYGGALHDPAAPVADNDCELLMDVHVPAWSGNAIRFCEGSRTTTVMPGSYGVRPWIYDGFRYPTLASGLSAQVTAGETATLTLDFAEWTGIVNGTVVVDGTPASSRYRVCLSTGGCSRFPRGDGTFRIITGEGEGEGVIWNDIGVELGRFAYGASAGGEVDLGTIGSNQPPVADASGSQAVAECSDADDGCTEVALDGSASSDLDGTVVDWTWTDAAGTVLATGATATAKLTGVGEHVLTLTVTDDDGDTGSVTHTVTVEDTTAPELTFALDVTTLWSPNHKLVTVASGITAADLCDGTPALAIEVTSNEAVDGPGAAGDPDWVVVDNRDGTYDLQLRAERDGQGSGRVYTLTVTATDAGGNATTATGEVRVPHDKGKKGS